jgi:protein-disulfide isomerase
MTTQESNRLTEPITERDHIRGPRSATVSLVEYGDFECPYCRAAAPIVAGLQEALGDQLCVVFRHFPLREAHPHAQHAAEVAEAAASHGLFWEMHDSLFAHQDALDDVSLLTYAAEIGLDQDQIERELTSHQHAGRVADDRRTGLASGVNGTPTFYLDGARYDGPLALLDMLAAIRASHPDVEVADAASGNPRVPRVKWPGSPGAPDA